MARQVVQEHHAITLSSIARANDGFNDVLYNGPVFTIGSWVWDNDLTAVKESREKDDEHVLMSKLSLDRARPLEVLRVDPSSSVPMKARGRYVALSGFSPSALRAVNAKRCVSVTRCKSCMNPHDVDDSPRQLPAGILDTCSPICRGSHPLPMPRSTVLGPLLR